MRGLPLGPWEGLFIAGSISTSQLCAALFLGLIATGCYGSGDSRRSPGLLFMGALLASSRQFWTPLWETDWLLSVQYVAILTVMLTLGLLVNRLLLDLAVAWYKRRQTRRSRALLVGTAEECERAREQHGERGDGAFDICGVVDIEGLRPLSASLRALDRQLRTEGIDTLIICGAIPHETFGQIARSAIAAECQMLTVYDAPEYDGLEPRVIWREGQPYIEFRRPALRGTQLLMKRALDILGASILLVALSPLLAVIALLVRLTSPGPAVFGQRRLGRYGVAFRCYKFRSMYQDAQRRLRADTRLHALYVANGFKLDPEVDTRITPLGRVLRKLSLDELPQLWNVLKGEMSLVGPRPIVPAEIRHYEDGRLLFLSVTPGITGAWQVNGRSELAYPERADVELEYVSNWSISSDIRILFRTIPAVLVRRGAF